MHSFAIRASVEMNIGKSVKDTIWIGFVREAMRPILALGTQADAMLNEAGISPALMSMSDARVAPASFSKLWHLIAHKLDDEFFGMDSRPMKSGSFTMLCHSIIHSENLEHALHRALRFLRLQLNDVEGCLVREGGLPASSCMSGARRQTRSPPGLF